MDTFLGLLVMAITCGLALLFILGIIFLISKLFKKSPSAANTLNKKLLIKWLRNKKSEGLNSIDELLLQLIPEKEIKSESKIAVPREEKSKIETSPIKKTEKKGFIEISSALILLYVGAFLIIFAIFVLVAFNWQTFSAIVKTLILLFVTGGFYTTGLILYSRKSLQQGAYTFLTVASISLAFSGLGIWNFLIKDNITNENSSWLNFETYWFIYSILLTSVYFLTLLMLKLRRFFILAFGALYSAGLSFSILITSDENFRIVVFSVLNLLFYFLDLVTNKYIRTIRWSSRIINQILDIMIIGTILGNIDSIDTSWLKIIAIVSLFIPLLFDMIVFLRENTNIESVIGLCYLVFKLSISALIMDIDLNGLLLMLLGYITTLILISEIYFKGRFKLLYWFSYGLVWLTSGFMSLALLAEWMSDESEISKFIGLVISAGISLILIFPNIFNKRYIILSIALTYLNFALPFILYKLTVSNKPITYIILFTIIYLVTVSTNILYKLYHKRELQLTVLPLMISSALILLGISIWGGNAMITYAFLLESAIIILLSILYSINSIRIISGAFIAIAITSLSLYINENTNFNLETKVIGIIFLISALIYAFIWDIGKFLNKHTRSEFIVFVAYSLITLGLTFSDKHYLLAALVTYALYSIYSLFRFKHYLSIYLIFEFVCLILITIFNLINLNYSFILLYFSVLTIVFNLIGMSFKYTKQIDLNNISKHFSYSSIALSFYIYVLIFIYIFINPHFLPALSAVIIGINLIISNKINSLIANLGGLGFILASWTIAARYESNLQFYIIPVALYFLALSIRYYRSKRNLLAYMLESVGYSIELTFLLIQSTTEQNENKILFGLILITLCTVLLLYSLYRKKKFLTSLSIVFLMIELIIRLYQVILRIPWWIYLALIGILLMSLAIYILSRLGKTNKSSE